MITSTHNPKLLWVRALLNKRQEREEAHAFVVEGVRLTGEALASGWQPQLVLYDETLSQRGQQLVEQFSQQGAPVEQIAPHLMDSITGTETPQGILAVFPIPPIQLPPTLNFVLIADTLRDPGNLGTLLRSAAAAGVQAVLLSPGTADAFAPKVVRAGMGAHFRLPVCPLTWEEISTLCRPALEVYIAAAEGGSAYWRLDLRRPLALIIGSEAEGASPQARALATATITIPMPGGFESLNAAVAAGVLIFEVVRQRNR